MYYKAENIQIVCSILNCSLFNSAPMV